MHRNLEQILADIDQEMKGNRNECYWQLLREVRYAMASRNRDLVYDCYGQLKMAKRLKALDKREYEFIHQILIYDGLNNYAIMRL